MLFRSVLTVDAAIVINEIHYDPDIKTEPVEFVELHNTGASAIDVSGWRLTDAVTFTIPNGTSIASGGYLVIGQQPSAILSRFGASAVGPWSGRLSSDGEMVELRDTAGDVVDEVEYQLGFPWPTVGDAPGRSIELIHPGFDNDLGGNWRRSAGQPTPGQLNSVFTDNAPPQMRQVDHEPREPVSGEPVTITVKATDPESVAEVTLLYQIVDPGGYVELTDPAYASDWSSMPMNDAGVDGDAVAGDDIFTTVLPGSLQTHRRLMRYRILAEDGLGASVTGPYTDDPQPNFAYFVYDGVPAWQAAVRPGATPVLTFDTNVMRRLPTVHLIARRDAVEDATWFERYGGDDYPWMGTLVYDGRVYDHIRYRARGGVWRYAMVKNMWKFDFNRGHDLEMRDDYGRGFETKWRKLNLGACIQQGDYWHRGEQGMFESVGFRLFNLAGVEAPHTTFLQFRVIDEAAEADPGTQYEGDFWGLYLGTEQLDGRFLDEHGLPDGNFYKMEGGGGELNNLGPEGPSDNSDLNYLLSNYTGATDAWWRTNWFLPNYYSYQTIVQAIHHYDINGGKNFFYYRNPDTGLWKVIPWDLDLSWAHNMFNSGWGGMNALAERILEATTESGTGSQSGTDNLKLTGARPAFELEFRNRVREIRDLLWNTNQAWQLIDEYAWLARGPTNGPTFLDADRSMWDYNPKMASSTYSSSLNKAGQGEFYRWSTYGGGISKDFNGAIQIMKNYVVNRAEHLDSLAADPDIPSQPTIAYTGPAGFPVNQLSFQSSTFGGTHPFAAMKWRLGEVTLPGTPTAALDEPDVYEITPVWESGELSPFNAAITIPPTAVRVGRAYRARVAMKDITGRWSHWSNPVEFLVGDQDNAGALIDHLKITELMYHAPETNELDFVELYNDSTNRTLDLNGVKFTQGIDYTFPAGTVLPPQSYLLVVNAATNDNFAAFRAHYGLDESVPIVGPYDGNFSNGGELVRLRTAVGGTDIWEFTYSDLRGWPIEADGAGHSLVPLENTYATQDRALDHGGNWRASTYIKGSPGRADPPRPAGIVLNEIMAHTDYTDPEEPLRDSNDWIELYNPTDRPLSLTGYYLGDRVDALAGWALPEVVIPAGGRISFDEVSGFNNPLDSGFGLNKAGEQVFLSQLSGGSEDRVVDAVSFQGQENFVSLGRYPDGGVHWRHMPPTRDATNSPPLASIVINEFMYNPPRGDGQDDNTPDEFVELFNPTGASIDLFGPDGVWRMADGINFIFLPDTSLPAGGHLLLVNFDPADATLLNAFRTRYGISAAVPVMGPYSGNLSNRGERVALEKPEAPDIPGDPYAWVIVDEVSYFDRAPFPPEADGNGPSLRRAFTAQSGNDPSNWTSGAPTPGASNDTEIPVPSAPASLTAQASDTQITLEWTASTWATSYRVKRATADGGPYTLLAMVTGTGHVDTNVSSGMTYFYVVSSVNLVGESFDSPQADATLPGPPPPPPTGLAATAGDGQVALNWNTVPGVSGYNVKRSALSGSPYTTIAPNLTTTTYTDFDVANGSTYYYVVSAENANGEGPHSAEVNARPRGVSDASPYASAVAAANPIAYWRLDEMDDPSSGTTTAYDSWADFHGTFGSAALNGFHDIAGPRSADGWSAFGNANVALRSTADTGQSWVTLPPLGVTTDSATITAWVNPVSHPSFGGIVFYRSGGGSASGLNLRNDGELGYHWNDDSATWSWPSGLTVAVDQWSFVALVVEPTQATMHVINSDGAQSATNAVAHSSRAFVDAMRVGGDPLGAGRTFDGRIDEVAFFDYALSPEQVQSLYAAALVLPVITLSIQQEGEDLRLTWPQGDLQQAFDVSGPYTNVPGATSPHFVSPVEPRMYFQVIMP